VIYLDHLRENGILTFSRFYHSPPIETYKLITLAKSALTEIGVKDVSKHIVLARVKSFNGKLTSSILVSKTPFTNNELASLKKISKKYDFEVILSKNISKNPNFNLIMNNPGNDYSQKSIRYNINPPTDDKPFYFYHNYFKDLFSKKNPPSGVKVLRNVSLIIAGFGLFFILTPLIFTPKSRELSRPSFKLILYFASIGLGFMLIEIPVIQRLGMFLGHPVYGLTIVLFSLLFSCSIGSYISQFLKTRVRILSTVFLFLLLLLILNRLLPFILQAATGATIPIKILISTSCISILGLFMGIFFPLGMTIASKDSSAPLTLYWGINGFCSMLATVLATILLIHFGFEQTLLCGFLCYSLTFFTLK